MQNKKNKINYSLIGEREVKSFEEVPFQLTGEKNNTVRESLQLVGGHIK